MNKSELFEVMGLGPVWTLRQGRKPDAEGAGDPPSALRCWVVADLHNVELGSQAAPADKLLQDICKAIEFLTASSPICVSRISEVDQSTPAVILNLSHLPASDCAEPGARIVGNLPLQTLLQDPLKKRMIWAELSGMTFN